MRKGAISFGLVTIPVNLYSAVERREALSFNLLHKKDHARIQNKRFCSDENVEVPWHDIVKGYEYAKNQYVVVTDEDFEKARVPATQTFDICAFVPAGELPRAERQERGEGLRGAVRRSPRAVHDALRP
jgi:DNA end-binding protein Ku